MANIHARRYYPSFANPFCVSNVETLFVNANDIAVLLRLLLCERLRCHGFKERQHLRLGQRFGVVFGLVFLMCQR